MPQITRIEICIINAHLQKTIRCNMRGASLHMQCPNHTLICASHCVITRSHIQAHALVAPFSRDAPDCAISWALVLGCYVRARAVAIIRWRRADTITPPHLDASPFEHGWSTYIERNASIIWYIIYARPKIQWSENTDYRTSTLISIADGQRSHKSQRVTSAMLPIACEPLARLVRVPIPFNMQTNK